MTAMAGAPSVVACANRPCARVPTARRLVRVWLALWGLGGAVFAVFGGKNGL